MLELLELLEQRPDIWLKELFPQYVTAEFGLHQLEFWEWLWSIEAGKQPRSFVAIWPRGHGKSTSTELACVALGARKVRRYALYVSETQDQADDHVANIGALLESSSIEAYYPELGNRLVGKYGTSKGWRRNRLRTSSGFTVDALGLDTAARGVKLEEQRPDLLIFDDIDNETDTPQATEKKIKILTRALIPAGSADVAVLAVQNLVHADSIFSRLSDGRADFLADRVVSGPTPALRGFSYEKQGNRHVVTSGTPTWDGMSLYRCQEMIDDMGISAFLAECQHDVKQNIEGALFPEFNEIYHVITWSEFAEGYGELAGNKKVARDGYNQPRIPMAGRVGVTQDFGTTEGHPTVTCWSWQAEDLMPLADKYFMYREQCLPNWPVREDPPQIVSPGRVLKAMHEAEKVWGEASLVTVRRLSHEQSAAANAYRVDAPEEEQTLFQKNKGHWFDGIPQIQEYLSIDYTQPHPFRKYPDGHPQAGEPVMGCPGVFWIVADGQGELYIDIEGNLCVRSAVDAAGQARARFEIPRYKNRRTAAGEEINRADKKDDDYVDALKMQARFFWTKPKRSPEHVRLEKSLPTNYKLETITKLPDAQKTEHLIARQYQLEKIEAAKQQQIRQRTPIWRRPRNF